MLFNLLAARALRRWIQKLEESGAQIESGVGPNLAQYDPAIQDADEYAFAAESVKRSAESVEWVFPKVQREAMGSLWEIYLAGTDRGQLVAAGEEALDQIERLDHQLSHYKPDSDISRINSVAGKQWARVEPGLYFLLKRCVELSELTDGAFDITTGPLTKAWGFFSGGKRIPPAEQIEALLRNVGPQQIQFDDEEWLVLLPKVGMEMNLGAIGKGFAIDEAVKTLKLFGAASAVVHGGQSTIYAIGESVGSDLADRSDQSDSGWRFEIKDPRDKESVIETVYLRDEAISTSGSYEDYFEADGIRYSHLLDPRSGYPAQGMLSVSVIAPNAADSDALSTAFFVMGREATESFCRSRPELRVIMMELGDHDALQVTRIGF